MSDALPVFADMALLSFGMSLFSIGLTLADRSDLVVWYVCTSIAVGALLTAIYVAFAGGF